MFKKYNLAGLEVEIAEGVHFSTQRKKRPSCYILDTGDRFSALLGEPAKRFYLDLVKQYEDWSHSEDEIMQAIFHHEYVYKAQVMIWRNSLEIPTEGVIEAPAEFQERINPDVFIEAMRKEALDIWEELMLALPDLREFGERFRRQPIAPTPLSYIFGRKMAGIAGKYLPKLRRLRVLELYLTYEQIQAVEALIHEYMYDVFNLRYYL